jgi:hypothetical protein
MRFDAKAQRRKGSLRRTEMKKQEPFAFLCAIASLRQEAPFAFLRALAPLRQKGPYHAHA